MHHPSHLGCLSTFLYYSALSSSLTYWHNDVNIHQGQLLDITISMMSLYNLSYLIYFGFLCSEISMHVSICSSLRENVRTHEGSTPTFLHLLSLV